jgi:preprotein translocase subunit YajC
MLISLAHAAGQAAATTAGSAPSTTEAFLLNILLILILVVMFYLLLIRPQQKRLKQHHEMLNTLKKGDKIITAAGFIGKIDKITEGSDEVIIDLGNSVKVTALRSTIHQKKD